jgi:D-alanine--poly(phosphoribitol) ligase subunit 2
MNHATENKIKEFLENNFLIDFDEIEANQNLFESGFIDSYGFIELINFLENEFDITIQNEELVNESLISLSSITNYINLNHNP